MLGDVTIFTPKEIQLSRAVTDAFYIDYYSLTVSCFPPSVTLRCVLCVIFSPWIIWENYSRVYRASNRAGPEPLGQICKEQLGAVQKYKLSLHKWRGCTAQQHCSVQGWRLAPGTGKAFLAQSMAASFRPSSRELDMWPLVLEKQDACYTQLHNVETLSSDISSLLKWEDQSTDYHLPLLLPECSAWITSNMKHWAEYIISLWEDSSTDGLNLIPRTLCASSLPASGSD